MKVTVTKVRRVHHATAWSEGVNAKGRVVSFALPWSAMSGIADDLEHGEYVTIHVPDDAIVRVHNPRMRRAA